MPRIRPSLSLCLALALAAPVTAAPIVRKAVFSDRQLFWPGLEGKGKPALPPKGRIPASPAAAPKTGTDERPRLVVLPIRVREYSESIPCDSCHRLSANGMEFFLENYLRERMEKRFPEAKVELAAPSDPLLGGRLDLMASLDSLRLPWDKWLPEGDASIIYRPRDPFTEPAARRRLDRVGGILGASHLLIPANVHVRVTPVASNVHTGGLDWGFDLVLWNVAGGAPEWALQYRESDPAMDLDQSLDGRLDGALAPVWDGMPNELSALWTAEPK